MPAVALTDRMNLHACINFYNDCFRHGIKPIIGAEILMEPVNDVISVDPGRPASFEIVVLCEDIKGYENLSELLTRIHFDESSNQQFAKKEWIEELCGKWIILSGGHSGEIFHNIINDNETQARQAAEWLSHKSGPGNFFIELGWHGLDSEKVALPKLAELSKQLNIPVVATNQCMYAEKSDAYAVELLKCIDLGTTVGSVKELSPESDQFNFLTVGEMETVFKNIPEAIKNTVAISDRCAVELPINQGPLTPKFEAPEGKNNKVFLEELCEKGLKSRYPDWEDETVECCSKLTKKKRKEIEKRLKFELETISKMGFISYFLIVADFVNHAKSSGIPVGPGRGSAAGSLVSYLLGITDIDPLDFGLLFERFLNPARKKMPDIDIDFCERLRGNVIKYVRDKYGRENVAQIATFSTLRYRAALRDVGRVLSVPVKKIDKLCALIMDYERSHKFRKTLIREALEGHDQLRELYLHSQEDKRILELASRIEGLPRNISTHAAGVVISPIPLRKLVPLHIGGESEVLTEFDMYSIDKFGFLKMDFLGLTTLTIIDDTLRLINNRQVSGVGFKKTEDVGQMAEDGRLKTLDSKPQVSNFKFQISNIKLTEIPLDDKEVFDLLQRGDLLGIFQLETSAGMKKLVQELKPTEFNDIIAIISLYRPGAMLGRKSYIERKAGREKTTYIHPKLEPILKETYGILVYQEQVMQILHKLVGYTLSEADSFRQIMSKKLEYKMKDEKKRFMKRALKSKLDEEKAAELFEKIEKFAGYGFNKSHATAYAFVAYQTAWLKTHYPAEFFTALLNNTSKTEEVYQNCKELNIKILPPDVNKSGQHFSVEKVNGNKCIMFGLEDVKNVGPAASENIINEREENGSFKNIDDFCRRINHRIVNRTAAESLVKSGACDIFNQPRKQMFLIVEDTSSNWASYTESTLQKSFFDTFDDMEEAPEKEGGVSTVLDDWDILERLSYEKEMLGIYVTGHPLDNYSATWRLLVNTDSRSTGYLPEDDSDKNLSMLEAAPETAKMGGLLLNADWRVSKRKTAYGILTFEDFFGTFEALVWSDKVEEYKNSLKTGEIYFVSGNMKTTFGKTSISAATVLPVETARSNWVNKIKISLTEDNTTSDKLKQLSEIVKEYKGKTAIEINLQTLKGRISIINLPEESYLKVTEESLEKIEKVFGAGAAKAK